MTIKINGSKEKKKSINKKDILEVIDDDFSNVIKERGKEYYNSGNILTCYKSNDIYYAKVEGSYNEEYNVSIEYTKDNGYDYDCDCPCTYPCKHEYAVALAIKNNDYEEKKLKENIPEKKYKIKDIIKEIPAEELKKYLLSNKIINLNMFDNSNFKSKFCKYFPKQEYNYYYNKLYNEQVLHNNAKYTANGYLDNIEEYITSKEYNNAFDIIKAIINAFIDTEALDTIVDIFPKMGMFLRISYRKGNKTLKDNIDKWIKELEQEDYYNNVYLEDVILSVK